MAAVGGEEKLGRSMRSSRGPGERNKTAWMRIWREREGREREKTRTHIVNKAGVIG